MKATTVMNMSLTVQRKVGWGTVVSVGYVGSLGRHIGWAEDLEPVPLGAQFLPRTPNPVTPGTPFPNAFLVPIQGYSAISYKADDASSNYHSLQVTANRRFTHGIQFGLAYTWSKAMDWVDTDFGAVNNAVPASLFRAWNYGLAGFDRTQILNLNWMWDVPNGSLHGHRYVPSSTTGIFLASRPSRAARRRKSLTLRPTPPTLPVHPA